MSTHDCLAMGVDAFGDPIHPIHRPRPVPGPDEIGIRVVAAAVNPADVGMIAGRYHWPEPVRFPLVPGYDIAGYADGTDQPVVAFTAHKTTQRGGYAEYVVLPADLVTPLPDGFDLTAAACLPLAGMTARQALDAIGPVETLMVNGPRGAIGGFVVELAAARGITIVEPGADGPVDAALDVIGGGPARIAFDKVRDGGRYVTVVPEFWVPGGPFTPERSITPEVISVRYDRGHLLELIDLAASGRLTPRVGMTLPLTQAADAHRIMARVPGTPTMGGKVVLIP